MLNKFRCFLLKLRLDEESKKEYEIIAHWNNNRKVSMIPVHVDIELIKRILKLEGYEVKVETVDFYGSNCFQRIEVRRN